MKYLNIIKKIEIDQIRKKRKNAKKTKRVKNVDKNLYFIFNLLIENKLVAVALFSFLFSIVMFLLKPNSFWGFGLFIFSYLIIYFLQIRYLYRGLKKEYKWFGLPFNRAINVNIKSAYCSDKKYLDSLLSLDIQALKFGYMELNSEYEYFKKRIHLVIGPLDKLGILPGLIASVGVLPKTIEIFGTNWISIFTYAYMILMVISLVFYNSIARYERMLSLTKLAIECKSNKTN